MKTRVHMLESEMLKKEKLIDELITKPEGPIDNHRIGGVATSASQAVVGGQFTKMKKFESHLT